MSSSQNKGPRREEERRILPFVVEFVKFSAGFAVIIAIALVALRAADVAGQVAAVARFW